MTKLLMVAGVIALALAGCRHAPTVWYKDGSTPTEFTRQKAQCEMEVARLPYLQNTMPWDVARRNNGFFHDCMVADGWRDSP